MANISDLSGHSKQGTDKTLYTRPEDSNINRFLLDCLPFNDVSFKQKPQKNVVDLGGYAKSVLDKSGKIKTNNDISGKAKAVSDTPISTLYSMGDSRITLGDNSNMGGYPL